MDPFQIAEEVYESTIELSMSEDYRKLTFSKILAHRLASIEDRHKVAEEEPATDHVLTEWHGRLADVIGLSPSEVSRLYKLDEDRLSLSVSLSKLPTNLRAATELITILILAGRQGLDLEASTSQSVVKDEAVRLKRLNRANFSSYVGGLEKYVTYRGAGTQRQLVLKPVGYQYALTIAKEILGVDE